MITDIELLVKYSYWSFVDFFLTWLVFS